MKAADGKLSRRNLNHVRDERIRPCKVESSTSPFDVGDYLKALNRECLGWTLLVEIGELLRFEGVGNTIFTEQCGPDENQALTSKVSARATSKIELILY